MTQSLNGSASPVPAADTAGAPTALLIHGFLDDASVWDGLVDSWRVRSAPCATTYPVRHAQRISCRGVQHDAGVPRRRSRRNPEGIDGPVIVVGQSLGTQVAELVAAQHSDQVRGRCCSRRSAGRYTAAR